MAETPDPGLFFKGFIQQLMAASRHSTSDAEPVPDSSLLWRLQEQCLFSDVALNGDSFTAIINCFSCGGGSRGTGESQQDTFLKKRNSKLIMPQEISKDVPYIPCRKYPVIFLTFMPVFLIFYFNE